MILAVRGRPGKPSVTQQGIDFESVEVSADPHANADADQHDGHEGDGGDREDVPEEVRRRAPALNRQIRIAKKNLDQFGYEPGCPRCEDLQAGRFKSKRNHNDACRPRMYCHFADTADPKWKIVAGHIDPLKETVAGGDFGKLDLDAIEAELHEPNLYEQPNSPLAQAEHFEPPEHVSAGMEREDEEENPDVVPAIDPSFPDLFGDEDVNMGGNEDANMVGILLSIGVKKRAA